MNEEPSSGATEAWVAALAGRRRSPAAANDPAAAEGLLLREALRRWPVAEPAADTATDQARLAALLAAAGRDRRLAAHGGCAACEVIARWWRWRRLASMTALAAVAWMAAVLVPWPMSVTTPAPTAADTFRGARAEGVQRLRAADPFALRERIVDDLAHAGVEATRYERLGRYGLDAELPPARSDEWGRLLGQYGIQTPPSGGLAIEIEAGP